MPLFLDTPINRKEFLKKTIRTAGAIASVGITYQWSAANNLSDDFYLALLADTHVKAYQSEQYRGFFPYRNMQEVVSQVIRHQPSMMIINGDVARLDGQLGDYIAIQELLSNLSGKIPVAMTMGNHDDRDNFYNIFGKGQSERQEITNKHVLVIERPDMSLLMLDSLMYVNKTPGFLGQEQRDWIDGFLRSGDDRPVFIFFHHTPYDGDSDLLDSGRLFDIVEKYRKVKAVFYGHSHVYRFSERSHIKLINQPAVGYNFIDSQPVGWLETRISKDRGIFTLHAIGGNMENDGKSDEIVWD
jgi:3',5'-cyclic AMP phosphodiesterase CpdA